MEPIFFATSLKFRKWLEKYHNKETELLVGFYKVGRGKASMNWLESVDEALCFGWIDGVRKSIDKESYSIRSLPEEEPIAFGALSILKRLRSLPKKV